MSSPVKALLAAALAAICLALPARAQSPGFPQNMPPNTVYGRSAIGTGPGQAIPFSVILQTLNNTANIWTAPQTFTAQSSFLGSNVAAITADGAQVVVQNSSTTAENVQTNIICGFLYDGTRSTILVPSGSTVVNANAFGAYVRNRAVSGGFTGNGVAYYGIATCGVSGSACWGANYGVVDSENSTGASLTGIKLAGIELDFSVYNSATIVNGMGLILGSSVGPGSTGYSVQINGTSKWSNGFVSNDGASTNAMIVGAASTSGTNIASQSVAFNAFDSAAAEHAIVATAIPVGTNLAFSILDNLRANGFFFESAATGNRPAIAAQGSDTNIGMLIAPKGAGSLLLGVGLNTITGVVATFAGLYSSADPGGVAATNGLSNANSSTISTGVGSIKMSTANAATNTSWLKAYCGTAVCWIPAFVTNAP